MKDNYFVIFKRTGIDRLCRSEKFTLKAGEHAVEMVLEVPDEVFIKPDIPVCRIQIDPSQVTRNISAVAEGTEEDGE